MKRNETEMTRDAAHPWQNVQSLIEDILKDDTEVGFFIIAPSDCTRERFAKQLSVFVEGEGVSHVGISLQACYWRGSQHEGAVRSSRYIIEYG